MLDNSSSIIEYEYTQVLVTAIENSKNLRTLNSDEFIVSLTANEGKMKDLKMDENVPKKMTVALKSSVHKMDDESNDDDEEEDIRLNKFLKRRSMKIDRTSKVNKVTKVIQMRDVIDCETRSHVRHDCPRKNKNEKHYKKRKSSLLHEMTIIICLKDPADLVTTKKLSLMRHLYKST